MSTLFPKSSGSSSPMHAASSDSLYDSSSSDEGKGVLLKGAGTPSITTPLKPAAPPTGALHTPTTPHDKPTVIRYTPSKEFWEVLLHHPIPGAGEDAQPEAPSPNQVPEAIPHPVAPSPPQVPEAISEPEGDFELFPGSTSDFVYFGPPGPQKWDPKQLENHFFIIPSMMQVKMLTLRAKLNEQMGDILPLLHNYYSDVHGVVLPSSTTLWLRGRRVNHHDMLFSHPTNSLFILTPHPHLPPELENHQGRVRECTRCKKSWNFSQNMKKDKTCNHVLLFQSQMGATTGNKNDPSGRLKPWGCPHGHCGEGQDLPVGPVRHRPGPSQWRRPAVPPPTPPRRTPQPPPPPPRQAWQEDLLNHPLHRHAQRPTGGPTPPPPPPGPTPAGKTLIQNPKDGHPPSIIQS